MNKKILLLIVFFSVVCAGYVTFAKLRYQSSANDAEKQKITKNLLENTTWVWAQNKDTRGQNILPINATRFEISFEKDHFSSTTDCNGVSGSYMTDGHILKIKDMMSTMMFCENSDQQLYTASLSDSAYFKIEGDKLVIGLVNDSGLMIFMRAN